MDDFKSLKSQNNPKIFLHDTEFWECFIFAIIIFSFYLQKKNINLFKGTFWGSDKRIEDRKTTDCTWKGWFSTNLLMNKSADLLG